MAIDKRLSQTGPQLPREPIDRPVEPLARFLHVEAASGVVLLVCTVTALVMPVFALAANAGVPFEREDFAEPVAILFIAGLALQAPLLGPAKVGVLGGSLVSAALGIGSLILTLPKNPIAAEPGESNLNRPG